MLLVLTIFSAVTFVGSLFLVPVIVARMREDYWVRPRPPSEIRHPVLRISVLVLKNVLGWVVLAAGVVMVPGLGPGLLTILAGLSLVNFPGKRELEVWIIRRRPVQAAVQWLRKRAGRPPLQIP